LKQQNFSGDKVVVWCIARIYLVCEEGGKIMKELILDKFAYFFWGIVVIVVGVYIYQFYKFKRVIDLDNKYKRFNDAGQLLEDGHIRAIYDYSFFPEFSRLWHKKEWQLAIATLFLAILFVTYLFTDKQEILNLLGINFGILIGTLIKVEKE